MNLNSSLNIWYFFTSFAYVIFTILFHRKFFIFVDEVQLDHLFYPLCRIICFAIWKIFRNDDTGFDVDESGEYVGDGWELPNLEESLALLSNWNCGITWKCDTIATDSSSSSISITSLFIVPLTDVVPMRFMCSSIIKKKQFKRFNNMINKYIKHATYAMLFSYVAMKTHWPTWRCRW